MSNKKPVNDKSQPSTVAISDLSGLEFVYKSVDPSYISNAVTGLSVGSTTLVSASCPPGLEALHQTDTLFLKPYSGPKVIAHATKNKIFEILNGEGERIFVLHNDSRIPNHETVEEERRNRFGVHMGVKNHYGHDVIEYYGTHGQVIKTTAEGSESWGEVTRHWESRCHCCDSCSRSKTLSFDAVIYNTKYWSGLDSNEEPESYVIQGTKHRSIFPTSSTRKLYYGTFECDIKTSIHEGDKTEMVVVGKMSSNLPCKNLGVDLPGIMYPKKMSVYHKAVLFGCLLVNVIRT